MNISTALRAGAVALVLTFGATSLAAQELAVTITYFGRAEEPTIPLSLVEPTLTDEGRKGAAQAVQDNQTTGRFLKHDYRLQERIVAEDGDVAATFKEALASGERLFVADLRAPDLLTVAPLADEAGAVILNARAPDVELRTEQCFRSVLHVAPDRAMKADALAQYFVWKRWLNWMLVAGSRPDDQAMAEAYRRAATKFGIEITDERTYEYTPGARRTDSGYEQVQGQMPVFTQGADDYDVMVVADESEVFGEHLPYRSWDARPVAGSAGLTPVNWSRVHEQWGGTQVQRRFERFAGRWMTERDYNAWLAVRTVGEAVTRAQTADAAKLRDYMLSDELQVAGFKGQGLSFRRWNQQMRQPILLTTPRMLVSVSPQEQFLHQRTPLDTLGFDEPESSCRLN